MSRKVLESILVRARQDGHFYQQLQADPLEALDDYELSQDERLALIRRDRAALEALGIPREWTDWFAVQH